MFRRWYNLTTLTNVDAQYLLLMPVSFQYGACANTHAQILVCPPPSQEVVVPFPLCQIRADVGQEEGGLQQTTEYFRVSLLDKKKQDEFCFRIRQKKQGIVCHGVRASTADRTGLINDELLMMPKQKELSATTRKRMMRMLGHTLRMSLTTGRSARHAIQWVPRNGRRQEGKPRTTVRYTLIKYL